MANTAPPSDTFLEVPAGVHEAILLDVAQQAHRRVREQAVGVDWRLGPRLDGAGEAVFHVVELPRKILDEPEAFTGQAIELAVGQLTDVQFDVVWGGLFAQSWQDRDGWVHFFGRLAVQRT